MLDRNMKDGRSPKGGVWGQSAIVLTQLVGGSGVAQEKDVVAPGSSDLRPQQQEEINGGLGHGGLLARLELGRHVICCLGGPACWSK